MGQSMVEEVYHTTSDCEYHACKDNNNLDKLLLTLFCIYPRNIVENTYGYYTYYTLLYRSYLCAIKG